MKIKNSFFTLLLTTNIVLAEESKKEEPKEPVKQEARKQVEDLSSELVSKKQWGAFFTYAYLDTWLPGKIGLTATYGDERRTFEFAYQQASYSFDFLIDDLGKISDRRAHLTTRSFPGEKSFNFQYGLFYNSLEVSLGNAYTQTVGDKYDLLRIDTAGVMWGLGNRWNWDSGLSVGADWFKVFWPLTVLNQDTKFIDEAANSDEKDDVQELVDGITKLPTFTFVHFELGYRF